MTVSTDFLREAVERLTVAVNKAARDVASNPGKAATTEPLEKAAKTVSVCLKLLGDIDAYNDAAAMRQARESYTAYEDLPPPRTEDRARIIAELMDLYDRVTAAQPLS